ncbi:MAG TPA: VOC family protein [bacterium]|nr:VOC family protein [bacterium]
MALVDRLDHIVLTVRDIEATCAFYSNVLGMRPVVFDGDHWALHFGSQKINLHRTGHEFEPKAERATPGAADLCFITLTQMDVVVAHLQAHQVRVIEGPGPQVGAIGQLTSVYFHDPDGNLIEISNYDQPNMVTESCNARSRESGAQ